jgi:hypothetical protein
MRECLRSDMMTQSNITKCMLIQYKLSYLTKRNPTLCNLAKLYRKYQVDAQ